MKMDDPVTQHKHIISELATRHPDLAYIHLVEARVAGTFDQEAPVHETLDFARDAWRKTGQAFLVAGGYTAETAITRVEKEGNETDCVVFGRHYIANVSVSFWYHSLLLTTTR